MKYAAALATMAVAGCLLGQPAQATAVPQELHAVLPTAALSGQATLRYWGFDIYQATLWVAPGFVDSDYAQSAFALELAYHRALKGADIAKRSVAEMRRQGPISAEEHARWEEQMRTLFPDVQSGDRITGVYLPQRGAMFWSNGRLLGEIRDATFAKRFFGIWLSPQTSEPRMRQALLSQAGATESPKP